MCACLVTMMVVLPALLVWQQQRTRSLAGTRPVPDFGMSRLIPAVMARPRRVLAGSMVLLVILGASAFRISFNEDMRALRPQKTSTIAMEQEMDALLGGASRYLLLVTEGNTEDQLLDGAWRLSKALDRLQAEGKVSHYRSILSYLPAPESQRQALAFLEHAADWTPSVAGTFRQALHDHGFSGFRNNPPTVWTMPGPGASSTGKGFEQAGVA
jgi:predicted exporter